jgi:hypothetical protein
MGLGGRACAAGLMIVKRMLDRIGRAGVARSIHAARIELAPGSDPDSVVARYHLRASRIKDDSRPIVLDASGLPVMITRVHSPAINESYCDFRDEGRLVGLELARGSGWDGAVIDLELTRMHREGRFLPFLLFPQYVPSLMGADRAENRPIFAVCPGEGWRTARLFGVPSLGSDVGMNQELVEGGIAFNDQAHPGGSGCFLMTKSLHEHLDQRQRNHVNRFIANAMDFVSETFGLCVRPLPVIATPEEQALGFRHSCRSLVALWPADSTSADTMTQDGYGVVGEIALAWLAGCRFHGRHKDALENAIAAAIGLHWLRICGDTAAYYDRREYFRWVSSTGGGGRYWSGTARNRALFGRWTLALDAEMAQNRTVLLPLQNILQKYWGRRVDAKVVRATLNLH